MDRLLSSLLSPVKRRFGQTLLTKYAKSRSQLFGDRLNSSVSLTGERQRSEQGIASEARQGAISKAWQTPTPTLITTRWFCLTGRSDLGRGKKIKFGTTLLSRGAHLSTVRHENVTRRPSLSASLIRIDASVWPKATSRHSRAATILSYSPALVHLSPAGLFVSTNCFHTYTTLPTALSVVSVSPGLEV